MPYDTEALTYIVQLARGEIEHDDGFKIEEWCAEYGRYISDPIYKILEQFLHNLMCVPDDDCRCRERKDGLWKIAEKPEEKFEEHYFGDPNMW